ncbi:MAG: 23S rRNA methyltransferase [Proteobacteria bacterium]|nr:23S rRNA methyltransferase [Pseudomonadota bacterium]|tara:strand:+ start:40 stop:651 length:612 start_codon:yes stop_codon:yes gene_type:complete
MVKKKWLNEFLSDKYVKDANREGFRSRAAFKLLQIDAEFGLFNSCSSVLDLGCAPGSWLQVAKRKTKPNKTLIIGVDILRSQLIQGVTQIEGDFLNELAREKILAAFNGRKIDVILSDMAPNLSGIKVVDGENIFKLVNLVLDFSLENLHKNGCLVVKAFETGAGSREFRNKLAKYFEKVWLRKPLASKKVSAEQFLIAKTLK